MTFNEHQYTQYTEDEATKEAYDNGFLSVRVTWRDGQSIPVTRDYRTDRINFELEKNRVIRAYVG